MHAQCPEALPAIDLGLAWEAAMAAGDFARAFAVNDAVLAARDPATRDDPQRPYHERWVWDGRDVAGRQVLVRCYHGLGDTLMYSRYLPELRGRARHVTVEAQAALVPLLRAQGWADAVVPFVLDRPLPPAEVDVEVMELAHALRLAPAPVPYLRADPPPRRHGSARVGLCWQASPTWGPERSVSAALFEPMLAQQGVDFVSLQRGARSWPAGLADDCPADVLDTVRRLASLDLVITVDTLVAHLAGAIGVQSWLLLCHRPDWRWRTAGGAAVWYLNMRQYRQEVDGVWDGAIQRALAALPAVVPSRPMGP